MSRLHIPSEAMGYVDAIRAKYSIGDIMSYLTEASQLRFSVIGEPITDEYVYVHPLGKAAKDNLISYAIDLESLDNCYRGGASIVAAHLSEAVQQVDTHLLPSEMIVKRRYIERASNQKIFALMPEGTMVPPLPIEVLEREDLGRLVVADFGHGLVTAQNTKVISNRAEWLGLTVQSNAANWGFNLLTKWLRADFVVVDEIELRLACGERDCSLEILLEAQRDRMGARVFAVTLGHRGCLILDEQGFHGIPALVAGAVDRMGTGDAFLAWSAPLACVGAPGDMVGLIGNLAGGLEASMVGNQPVTRRMMLQKVAEIFGEA